MKLHITQEVQEKVWYWIDKADFEVSGFGIIEIIDGVPVVVDAFLLDQEGSGGETELKAEAINRAEFETRNLERGEMKWWWHSHVNMNVYWSPQDKSTIAQLGTHGWFFHTVFNKKRELRSAFSCPQVIDNEFVKEKSIYMKDEVETVLWKTVDAEKIKVLDKAFDDKVKKRKVGIDVRNEYFNTETNQWEPRVGKGKNKKKGESGAPFFPKPLPALATRQDCEKQIEEAFEEGNTNAQVEFFFERDIRKHGFNIETMRRVYCQERYAEGYGHV